MTDKIITEALELYKVSEAGSGFNRTDARLDVLFARLGQQWPNAMKAQRELEGRPCLTINRLPAFIRQVVNDARQNTPAVSVTPTGGGARPEEAEIIGGLVRAIERNSNAALAYDTALEHAVDRGFGFFRVTTDYCHDETFDMEARIERVANPFSVHWDVSSTQFDASDWEYAFVSEMMTEAEFKSKHPKGDFSEWPSTLVEDAGAGWMAEIGKKRVAEYWRRSTVTRKLVQWSDGSVVQADAMDKPIGPGLPPLKEIYASQGLTVARERDAEGYKVKRRIMTATEVLSETDWPGTMIPICPVWGEEVLYEGRRHFRSLVRDAMDPQRMFNFWRSASTELVALAPRAPWIVEEGAIPPSQEEKWRTANTRSHPYLTFRKGSHMPQRQPFSGVPAGAIQEALNASDDMKAIMGIYDASLGARSNETSGKAIMARQREGDVGTFHFIDNLNRAIQYCGRVLVEIIPSVYSDREAIQILGSDEAPKIVKLGKDGAQQEGGERLYDLSVGKYSVTVKSGPSYTTQREAAKETLIEIMRAQPEAAAVLGDVLVQNMDFPQSDIVVRRLKALLPPQVQMADAEAHNGGMPPEAQAMMASMKQQMEQMHGQLQQAGAELQNKQADTQIKMAEVDVKKAEIQAKREEIAAKVADTKMRGEIEVAKLHIEAERLAFEQATHREEKREETQHPAMAEAYPE